VKLSVSRSDWPDDCWLAEADGVLVVRMAEGLGIAAAHPPTRRRKCGVEAWCVGLLPRSVRVWVWCRNARRRPAQKGRERR
jgi:hypothetical protein